MFRVLESAQPVDDTAGTSELPAHLPQYVGTAFAQQTPMGVRHVDDKDDRVTFEASIYSDSPQAFSIGLGSDMDGVGRSSVYGGLSFHGVSYGELADTGPNDGRPRIGFPLSHESDEAYASRTGDMAGATVNDEHPLLLTAGEYLVPEKPIQLPYRLSRHPAEIQHEMPWDITMGSFPWTGEKVALQRPYATSPMTFDTPLLNALPSPTGTSGSDISIGAYNLEPRPLTFRITPDPWDTDNNGQFVDAGGYG